ncbi:MAG: methionyl-tRNA formyltransferase [Pseudomonadota bacterium]
MKLIFMGTPDFSVPALQALVNAGHDVVCVYSQPPRKSGRGQKERPSPVHTKALKLGLDIAHPTNFKDPADVATFEACRADVAVVVAYGLILPQAVLQAPRLGCLNIHASLLPRWRGAAPIHRAIMAGDRETGVGIMQMETGLDTGPVLHEVRTAITAHDTTGDLHDRLSNMGAQAIVHTLAHLDNLKPTPHSGAGVSYAAKIEKSEAQINWSQPAAQVDAHIRGLSPFPGAWFDWQGARVKVLRSTVATGSAAPAGQIIGGTTVACSTGAVTLTELQPAGKRPMSADEFLKGRDFTGRLNV